MKTKSVRILQIISGVYVALYLAAVISSIVEGDISFQEWADYLFLFLFLLLVAGFSLSWNFERVAGITFLVWVMGIWIFDLLLTRGKDSGMLSIMAVPGLVIGALLLLNWYKTTKAPSPPSKMQWKFILRVLLISYAVLYAIVVISEVGLGNPQDYFSLPFVLFPLMLLLFLSGFAVSWRWELAAGILFVLWSALLVFGSVAYTEIFNSGPWAFFGIPVLLQGIFYIRNRVEYKSQ
jgi:hypothetical protein